MSGQRAAGSHKRSGLFLPTAYCPLPTDLPHAASFGSTLAWTTDAIIAPLTAWPKLTLNWAQPPAAVGRMPRTWYCTCDVPAGIVESMNFFSPVAPRNVNSPSLPMRRQTWYVTPLNPVGLLAFQLDCTEPSAFSSTLK